MSSMDHPLVHSGPFWATVLHIKPMVVHIVPELSMLVYVGQNRPKWSNLVQSGPYSLNVASMTVRQKLKQELSLVSPYYK